MGNTGEESKRVLITGFGPFSGIEVNPSWEGVNSMNKEEIETKYNINLYTEKIDAHYNYVDSSVPKLWDKLQPHLTIHVGVSGAAPCFLLETQACKCGYKISDSTGACPAGYKHSCDGPETIVTDLDVDFLCNEFNGDLPAEGLHADKSCDAGRYLCEYTYYTSLNYRGISKTLFVHVPQSKYSFEEIAQGVERILQICLRQIGHN